MQSKRVKDLPDHWVVLSVLGGRVKEAETEFLARGWEAWTPKVWVRKRLPRRKARRLVVMPLLPGYLFLRGSCFPIYEASAGAFPYVRRILVQGEDMRVRDDQLAPLRQQDAVARGVDQADPDGVVLETFDLGERVRLDLPAMGPQCGSVSQILLNHHYEIHLDGALAGRVAVPHFLIDKET